MNSPNKLLSEVDDLKLKLVNAGSPIQNTDVWSFQQLLQAVCGKLLVDHQELALEHGVERDLWNCGFRITITQLQSETKERKKGSTEVKDVLNWFLNAASGFYLHLLNQISSSHSLDFVFRRKDSVYGLSGGGLSNLPGTKIKDKVTKNACYLCQYCLIHLGDLARYRHQAKQAETFYRHAVTVAPTSGHPYNQLALLEAGRGNKLASVFLYIRALCVTAPFPGAPSNLIQTLTKVLKNNLQETKEAELKMGPLTRLTKDEYISLFLHFHSSLLLKGDLEVATKDLPRLFSALSMLVATTTLTRSSLVQMFAINLFALHFFSCKFTVRLDDSNTRKEEEKLIEPKECEGALDLLEDLMVSMLAALLLPIHTMKEPEVVMTYPALPAIRLILEWILIEGKLSSHSLKKKQQIWPGLCSLVNFLQIPLAKSSAQESEDTPLPEDWDLQGFQPVSKILCRYKFKESCERLTPDRSSLLQAKRLTDLASRLSAQKSDGSSLIKRISAANDCVHFEACSDQKPPVDEVLDLERLTLNPSQVSIRRKDKVGILKPQGSLERAKENRTTDQKEPIIASNKSVTDLLTTSKVDKDTKIKISSTDKHIPISGTKTSILVSGETTSSTTSSSARSRVRTNVALQAILKRNSIPPETKQVKFQTPSPAVSPKVSTESASSETNSLTTLPGPPNQRGMSFHPFSNSLDYSNRHVRPSNPIPNLLNVGQFNTASSQFNNAARPGGTSQFPSAAFMVPLRPPPEDMFVSFSPSTAPISNLVGGVASIKNPELSSFSQHMIRQQGHKSPPFTHQNLFTSGTPSISYGQTGSISEPLPFLNSDVSLYQTQSSQWDSNPSPSVPSLSHAEQQQLLTNTNFSPINKDALTAPYKSPPFPTTVGPFDCPNQLRSVQPSSQLLGSFPPQLNPNMMTLYGQGQSGANLMQTKDPLNSISGLTIGRPLSASAPLGIKPDLGALNVTIGSTVATGSNFGASGGSTPSFWGEKEPSAAMYLSQLMTRPPPLLRGEIDTSIPPPPTKESMLPLGQGFPTNNAVVADQTKFDPRASNTYSLFGPLGDSSSAHVVSSQQMIASQPQQSSHQSLWSGPSPLQRLLEQKKFSSTK